jgi:Leucine-rich repeat (LRR) protein
MTDFDIDTYLNLLPDDELLINVSNLKLKYLPSLHRFNKLEQLYCQGNELTELPELNETLQILNCANNNLTCLPNLNSSLQELYCYNNYLLFLPELNPNLRLLNCGNNELSKLPNLNEILFKLQCYGNQLEYLPELNDNLNYLDCGMNNILYLPKLNPYLEHLYCSNNKLTHYPTINNNLIALDSSCNKLPSSLTITCFRLTQQEKDLINRFNKCRFRIMCLKYKRHFREWLYIKIRLPKIEKKYSPKNLVKILDVDNDLLSLIEKW